MSKRNVGKKAAPEAKKGRAKGKVPAKKPVRKAAKPRDGTKKAAAKVRVKAPAKKAARVFSGATEKRGRGRPSKYNEQLGMGVCGWIKQGYTLRQIGELPNMPSKSLIIQWIGDHPEFLDHYVRAREVRAFVMEDEIEEIAEDSRNDWLDREGKDGQTERVPDVELVARTKIRIDSRKWLMAKMAPKRYGERLALTGKDGGAVRVQRTVSDVLEDIDGAGTGLPRHVKTDEG